ENATLWSIAEQLYDANGNVIETRRYDNTFDDTKDPRDRTKPNPVDMTKAGLTMDDIATELTALGYTDDSKLANVERTRFAYDVDNHRRFTVDALGDVSENVYDAAGSVVMNVRYAGVPTLTAYSEADINAAVDRTNGANQVSHF